MIASLEILKVVQLFLRRLLVDDQSTFFHHFGSKCYASQLRASTVFS